MPGRFLAGQPAFMRQRAKVPRRHPDGGTQRRRIGGRPGIQPRDGIADGTAHGIDGDRGRALTHHRDAQQADPLHSAACGESGR